MIHRHISWKGIPLTLSLKIYSKGFAFKKGFFNPEKKKTVLSINTLTNINVLYIIRIMLIGGDRLVHRRKKNRIDLQGFL